MLYSINGVIRVVHSFCIRGRTETKLEDWSLNQKLTIMIAW